MAAPYTVNSYTTQHPCTRLKPIKNRYDATSPSHRTTSVAQWTQTQIPRTLIAANVEIYGNVSAQVLFIRRIVSNYSQVIAQRTHFRLSKIRSHSLRRRRSPCRGLTPSKAIARRTSVSMLSTLFPQPTEDVSPLCQRHQRAFLVGKHTKFIPHSLHIQSRDATGHVPGFANKQHIRQIRALVIKYKQTDKADRIASREQSH